MSCFAREGCPGLVVASQGSTKPAASFVHGDLNESLNRKIDYWIKNGLGSVSVAGV